MKLDMSLQPWIFLFLCSHLFTSIQAASPTIAMTTTPLSVSESTALQTQMATSCTTSDADGVATTAGTYYLEFAGGNTDFLFAVVGQSDTTSPTCSFYVIRELDYETLTSHTLIVRAKDLTNAQTDSTLVITVVDANDNAPSCTNAVMVGVLTESAATGTQFFDLSTSCSDVDTGVGAQFEYSVVSGDTTYIDVGLTTGLATLKSGMTLDYETKQAATVIVHLIDKGSPALTGTVTVILSITDEDDNIPVFTDADPYTATLAEGSTIGTTIHTFAATDTDSISLGTNYDLVTYGFVSTPVPDVVVIDATTGALITKADIDYETSTTITATVYAHSSSLTASTATIAVTVTVTDINDNTPVFGSTYYTLSVAENAAFGDTVGTIAATDADATDVLTYALSGTGNTDFNIDTSTGAITVKIGSDYETSSGYVLIVTASDGTNTQTVYVTITVTEVNEFDPVFAVFSHTGGYYFHVTEDTLPGASVALAIVTCTDADTGDDGTVNIVVTTSGAAFSTDTNTGVVRVALDLDYETATSHVFEVECYDSSSTTRRTATATMTASIQDVNDVSIPCDTVSTQYIPDPSSVGYIVATLVCTDVDLPGDALTYTISSQVETAGGTAVTIFTMTSASSPELVLSATPSHTRYTVVIDVTDNTDTTQVTVTVVTETLFTLDTITGISQVENVAGVSLYTFTSSAVYPFVQYEIDSGNTDSKVILFRTTGELLLLSPYDMETTASYTYGIKASSTSGQVATGTLTVTVTDLNDNTPAFGAFVYFVNVDETLASGSTIATYSATDADTGATYGPVTHALVSGNSAGKFAYDATTGVLTTAATLDYETTTAYYLVLEAADAGDVSISQAAFTGTTTVVISVTNSDDNTNSILMTPTSATQTLAEDNSLGSSIVQVQASDADTGIAFTYSISSGNTNNDFAIDPVTGQVTQVNLLDRETTASYSLVLLATDQNAATTSSSLAITVSDINDNDPEFSTPVYQFTVAHQAAAATSIGDLVVTDLDDGVNSAVTITIDDAAATGIFSLTGSTSPAAVQTDVQMDYQSVTRYSFQVKVVDTGATVRSSTARVVVNVLPASTTPKFDPTSDSVTLDENKNTGFQVYDLDATVYGASEDDNTMQYTIDTITPASDFSVIAATGEVITSSVIDYEVSTSYTIVIKACIISDCTNLQDSFTLTVTITDLNDNTPYFSQQSYEFSVEETQAISYIIDTITAQDGDASSTYNTLTYTLTGTSSAFILQGSTGGIIQTGTTLDYATTSVYTYTLKAYDGGSPALSTDVSVVINIIDSNTNDPAFTTATYIYVMDSNAIGSEVYHVHATDADTGTAGTLSYGILSDTSNGVFSMDATTGIMTTASLMDGALIATYTLVIQVEDGGTPTRSATQTMTVSVISTSPNYNDPVFATNPISVTLDRAATTGTTVATASATDTDNSDSGTVQHKLISGNTNGLFTIDSSTGIITTIASVAEADDVYTLLIVAKDKGTPMRSATATVSIAMNSPKTTFATFDYQWSIAENSAQNTQVGYIEVDTGRTISGAYSIIAGNFATTFKISTHTDNRGILAVENPPDYETKANFSLEVSVVTDIGTHYKFIQVAILDLNDNPPVFAQTTYTLLLPENTPVGTTMLQLPWSDADTDAVNRDNIVEIDTQGAQIFSVDQSGILTISTVPDYETMAASTTFSVTVREQNSPLTTATSIVTLTILDITEEYTGGITNRNPFISVETPYPSENGDHVYTLTVGALGGDNNRFDFETTNLESTEWFNIAAENDPFIIDSSTGIITVGDASVLEDDTQYVRWVVGRATYTDGTIDAKLGVVRIDTFNKYTYMVVIEFSNDKTTVDSKIDAFQRTTAFFFTNPETVSFSYTYDTSTDATTQAVAYTYCLKNWYQSLRQNINTAKTYMTSTELLAVLQLNSSGSPITGLSSNSLVPTIVAPFAQSVGSVISANETFWTTETGMAVLILLVAFIGILVGIVVFCWLFVRQKQAVLEIHKEDFKKLEAAPDTISVVSIEEVETKRWNAQRWDFMDHLVNKPKKA